MERTDQLCDAPQQLAARLHLGLWHHSSTSPNLRQQQQKPFPSGPLLSLRCGNGEEWSSASRLSCVSLPHGVSFYPFDHGMARDGKLGGGGWKKLEQAFP